MKIEKISETQVKFILSQMDLAERNLKLTELAYGSEKTQALFREMMEQAVTEYGIEFENTPIMIEAIPLSPDSIIIIVTKVMDVADIEEKFNSVFTSNSQKVSKNHSARGTKPPKAIQSGTSVFYFDDLDSAINAASRLYGFFDGTSILFKFENRYYLFLEKTDRCPYMPMPGDDLDAILSEYGFKYSDKPITRYFLQEHGEVIVRDRAIDVLANI